MKGEFKRILLISLMFTLALWLTGFWKVDINVKKSSSLENANVANSHKPHPSLHLIEISEGKKLILLHDELEYHDVHEQH